MFRHAALMLLFLTLGHSLAAQDAIPPETLAAVKHATVFIQVVGPSHKATGSGFVVKTDQDTVLIATNHHVIGLPENDKKARLTPSELSRTLRLVNITVVFDPGTKNEVSMKAEAVAADPDEDLAILRVTKVKDPPKPIAYAAAPKLTETMPVYTFGFPFGNSLATSKGAPAITVGKGSVSSLRLDDDGELAVVQIDGALNPGNSGGPVVDVKGQLVGVAVATIKNGQGIGLAVPGHELGKIMKGRLGGVHLAANGTGKRTTRAEVEVVDPTGAVKGVKLVYVLVPPNGTKPDLGKPLDQHAGAKSVTLKATGDLASGEVPVDNADGTLYVQAVPQGGLGEKGASPMRDFGMSAARGVGGGPAIGGPAVVLNVPALNAKPPEGWKDYLPKDRTFNVWVPVKNTGQRDSERTQTSSGVRMKFNVLTVDLGPSRHFIVEEIIVPQGVTNNRRAEFEVLVRDILLEAVKGRLTNSFEVRMGANRGQEYRIQSQNSQLRARVFVVSNRIVVIQSDGPRDFVEGADSDRFLDSCRLLVGGGGNIPQPKVNPPPPSDSPFGLNPGKSPDPSPFVPVSPKTNPGPMTNPPPITNPGSEPTTTRGGPSIPAERKSNVQGGSPDSEFAEESPNGTLVGLELAIGDFLGNQIVYALRPVFRSGDLDKPGQWRGGKLTGRTIQKTVAKPGYALGAISLKTGLGIDAVNLTFMKVNGDRLDPRDQYASGQIGGAGGGGWTKVGGDDTRLPVGLLSRSMKDWVSGVGLIYADQPKPAPPVNTPSIPPTTTTPGSGEAMPPKKPGIATPAEPDGAEPEKKSKLPLILGVVGGVVFLLGGIGVLAFVLMKSNQKGTGKRSRRSSRYDDDDDDDDDDDRPRRRSRRR